VKRDLKKSVPTQAVQKLLAWAMLVEGWGLDYTNLHQRSFHMEPLRGKLKGRWSVRLTLKWRAIYRVVNATEVVLVKVERITPHEY
jgi:hypothetical protein